MPTYNVKFEEIPEFRFESLTEAILFLTELANMFHRYRPTGEWLAAAKMGGSADYLAAITKEGWLDA